MAFMLLAKLPTSVTGPAGRAQPALLRLPDELLLDITDHLTSSDVACLSLCNRTLGLMFARSRSVLHLRENEHLLRDLLVRLARDRPTLFCCDECLRLHPISRVPPPAMTGLRGAGDSLRCITQLHSRKRLRTPLAITGIESAYRLEYQHVQLALAHDRTGRGMPLHKLGITEVQGTAAAHVNPRQVTLLSVEPRIVNGALYLRVRHQIIVGVDYTPRDATMMDVPICAHIQLRSVERDPDYRGAYWFELQFNHGDRSIMNNKSVSRCNACATEFGVVVQSANHHPHHVAFVIKWLYLGSGRDPSDAQWKAHLHQPASDDSPHQGMATAELNRGTKHTFEFGHARSLVQATYDIDAIYVTRSYMEWNLHPASTPARRIYTKMPPSFPDDWSWGQLCLLPVNILVGGALCMVAFSLLLVLLLMLWPLVVLMVVWMMVKVLI